MLFEGLHSTGAVSSTVLLVFPVDTDATNDAHKSDQNCATCHNFLGKFFLRVSSLVLLPLSWITRNGKWLMGINGQPKPDFAVFDIINRVEILQEKLSKDILLAAVV